MRILFLLLVPTVAWTSGQDGSKDVEIINTPSLPRVAMPLPAAKDIFAEIFIEEEKTEDEISFSLKKVRLLNGNRKGLYKHSVEPYVPEEKKLYFLKIYSTEDGVLNMLAIYSVRSSRFALWDGIDKDGKRTGGTEERKSGIISVVIPYDEKKPITHIGIISKVRETRFKVRFQKK